MTPDDFITAALRASILISPRDHGLTREEVLEAGKLAGFKPGELGDALQRSGVHARLGQPRLRVTALGAMGFGADFNHALDPEVRDVKAFEFIRRELQELAAEVGEANAKLDRDVLVSRGVAKGLDGHALEVAITVTVLDGILEETDGVVTHVRQRLKWILPSEQIASRERIQRMHVVKADNLAKALTIVKDVVARRDDGRVAAADPLDAFEKLLAELGQDRFRAWWVQERRELRLADISLQPVSVLVHSAALAEATLSFVVPRAQSAGLMKRIDATKARQWRFVDLIQGAKSGDPNLRAILDERTAQRCLDLNETRQRIHAGYLIDTTPTGPVPDLKPEQARDALHTLELLVRKVIEWLDEQKRAALSPP